MFFTARHLLRSAALAAASVLLLAGCATEPAAVDSSPAPATDVVTIEDAWVKAADDGMSAAFGILHNSGEDDIAIVEVSTEVATSLEMHETVENESGELIMRAVESGFVIPARGALTLEPGADHLMLMGLTAPLHAGDEISITLTFADQTTQEFSAPVKDYSGANENYHDGMDH